MSEIDKILGTEETKEEVTKEETKEEADKKEALILGKFKDIDGLTKSYQELEKKLGEQVDITKLDDEGLIKHNKKLFGDLATADSKLEDSLKGTSESIRDLFGVPTKIVDAIVAKSASKALETKLDKTRSDINEVLKDKENRLAFEAYVKEQKEEFKTGLKERIENNEVSVGEITLMTELGKKVEKESPDALGAIDLATTGTDEALMEEYLNIVNKQGEAWNNPKHPNYTDTVKRKMALKKRLKLP